MKKGLSIILAVLILFLASACGAPAEEPAAVEEPEVVVFTDPLLESMVREVMGVPEGDITVEAAEALTFLDLNIDWQQEPVPGTQIEDISALKYFKNLESLDIQFHSITDISPLAGMTKLKGLGIGGNQIQDISPLSGLTNLEFLALFNCRAVDYSPLKNLVKLKTLFIGYSTIEDVSALAGLKELETLSLNDTLVSDVTPLAGLTNLKRLQLKDSKVKDFSPLAPIYMNLIEKDFTLVQSLSELGFEYVDDFIGYKTDENVVTIRYDDFETKSNYTITVMPDHTNEKYFDIVYYPGSTTYVISINDQSRSLIRYTYDIQTKTAEFENGEEQEIKDLIIEIMPEAANIDTFEAPVKLFDDRLKDLFGMGADELYTLPFEVEKVDENSLLGKGFRADPDTASYYYEQQLPHYFNLQIYNPEWGTWEEGGNVRFFTPLSDECRIVVTYYIDERKFLVGTDDNDGGGAKFEFFIDTHEKVDGWCSDPNMTVEEYYKNAYNDPSIEDIYFYSVELMTNAIQDAFNMSMEDLYALPSGE